jgi:recombination protein RecA
MALDDVLKVTNSELAALAKKKEKGKSLFSFGHEEPSLAVGEGAGDPLLYIPTGITLFDAALGGGLPVGRVTELFSENESEGKTTLALTLARAVINAGGAVVWLESESAIDKARAANMGVDLSKMVIWTPDTLEDGFRFVDKIVKNIAADKELQGKPTLIVWDTISMARTEAERDGDAFRDGIGAAPRAIATALKNYAQEFVHYNVHFLIVNQSYTNINAGPYGKQFETPGGKRIKFAATTRIQLKRCGWIGDKRTLGPQDEKTGILVRATTVKNKVALSQRRVELALYGKTGLSEVMTLAHAFIEGPYKWAEGLATKAGGRYQPIGMDRSVFWSNLEQAVLESPATLAAWRQRAMEIFPVHPSRQINADGWYARVKEYDDSRWNAQGLAPLSFDDEETVQPLVPLAPPIQ